MCRPKRQRGRLQATDAMGENQDVEALQFPSLGRSHVDAPTCGDVGLSRQAEAERPRAHSFSSSESRDYPRMARIGDPAGSRPRQPQVLLAGAHVCSLHPYRAELHLELLPEKHPACTQLCSAVSQSPVQDER
uniref:Uncharacterized protein n=1 Tax=Rangifer tarandus platyrhynchus TaxID=3082113 RepID=A0ACB0F5K0_RANTA|nr:unnamed protein product [Rangifer tarandus platyrhynchus]